MKPTLARLVLAASLVTGAGACGDRAPHVVTLQAPSTMEPERPGTMTVQGSATLDVSPDCADLTMTLSSDGARPGQAATAVQAKQAALLAALKKLGIETSDIKLSHLNMSPVYAPNPDGWSTLKVATYRAEITITATTKQFELVGAIMEAGATAGASSMSSAFRRSDIDVLKKRVRDMALKAAKEKAAQTAGTLGIQLGRVVSVTETPAGAMWGTPYFSRNLHANYIGSAPTSATVDNAAIGGSTQSLSLDIVIGYELAKQA